MKKSLLIIFTFCICILNVNAQIIITTADMPTPTKIIYQAIDSFPTISIGAAGPSQTWDMTALGQNAIDTSTVFPYSYAPNASFSTANLAIKQGSQNYYGYCINSPSSMTFIGGAGIMDLQGTQIPLSQFSTPAEILFNFPTSYDSSFTNNFTASSKFYYGQQMQGITIDSIYQKSVIKKTFVVDAWGTLTTPLAGGPYNVLRIKETKIKHDTTKVYAFYNWNDIPGGLGFAADSVVTYTWVANGLGAPLATATMDSIGNIANVQWLYAPPAEPPLSATVNSTNETCGGLCNGTAIVTANWGTPPYTYSWNTNPVQNNDTVTALCVGTYIVTITDDSSSVATVTVVVNASPLPIVTANGTVLSTNYSAASFQWYLNGLPITGANSSHYTVTQNGNYSVSVSNGNSCSDTSAVHNFNNIGITESEMNNSVSIYPNPVTSQITIKFDESSSPFMTSQDLLIDIKNELGQSIVKAGLKKVIISKNEIAIDANDLPSGIYFIKIQNHNSTINKKFVKQ